MRTIENAGAATASMAPGAPSAAPSRSLVESMQKLGLRLAAASTRATRPPTFVLGVTAGKDMTARPVGHEEQVIAIRRMHHGVQAVGARGADWRRRQPGAAVSVEWIIPAQFGPRQRMIQHAGSAACQINDGRISLQPHSQAKPVQIDRRHMRRVPLAWRSPAPRYLPGSARRAG